MESYLYFIESIINLSGVAIISIGFVLMSIIFINHWLKKETTTAYKDYRQNLSRVILLGLEFLIAGDIIHSVAGTPTMPSVTILLLIILIRLILTWELQMEIDGKLPWQKSDRSN